MPAGSAVLKEGWGKLGHFLFGGIAMRRTVWAALAAGLLAVTGADSARADGDVVRLGGVDVDGDVDTQLVYRRGGGFGFSFGFSRGGWGGYRGGWGGGWGG